MNISIAISPNDVQIFEAALSQRSIEKITATVRNQTDDTVYYDLKVTEGCEDELFELGYRYGYKKQLYS